MRRTHHLLPVLIVIIALCSSPGLTATNAWQSTRVTDPNQHVKTLGSGYPYRAKSEYVLRELDLRPGDAVVDIGAGDGWWAERMAALVGLSVRD